MLGVGARGDLHPVLGEHAADRLDPEPVALAVDERHYQGSRGSSSRAKNELAASRISFARRSSRTSASRSLIRLASAVLVPGCSPASMRCCLTQFRKVSGTIPTFGPIRFTAAFTDNRGSSAIASATIRNARSRSSSGYFLGAGTDPLSRGFRASTKPGAVQWVPTTRDQGGG